MSKSLMRAWATVTGVAIALTACADATTSVADTPQPRMTSAVSPTADDISAIAGSIVLAAATRSKGAPVIDNGCNWKVSLSNLTMNTTYRVYLDVPVTEDSRYVEFTTSRTGKGSASANHTSEPVATIALFSYDGLATFVGNLFEAGASTAPRLRIDDSKCPDVLVRPS